MRTCIHQIIDPLSPETALDSERASKRVNFFKNIEKCQKITIRRTKKVTEYLFSYSHRRIAWVKIHREESYKVSVSIYCVSNLCSQASFVHIYYLWLCVTFLWRAASLPRQTPSFPSETIRPLVSHLSSLNFQWQTALTELDHRWDISHQQAHLGWFSCWLRLITVPGYPFLMIFPIWECSTQLIMPMHCSLFDLHVSRWSRERISRASTV